jgi:hypothetical protein
MRKILISLLTAAGLAVSAAAPFAAEEGAAVTQSPQAAIPTINWFDPAAWMAGVPGGTAQPNAAQPGQTFAWNPAHPASWALFIDPQNHEKAHMAFMNPAQYAQFMSPQFYMQFANPANMMAWMNPAAYATFMNPATYMGWMNPNAYAHMMNPAMYMQPMNPAAYTPYMNPNTYMQWMNPAAYAMPAATGAQGNAANMNWFDPNAWAQMMTPNAWTQGAQPQQQ